MKLQNYHYLTSMIFFDYSSIRFVGDKTGNTLCTIVPCDGWYEDISYCALESGEVWHMRNPIVVPVVIGALGAVSVNFKKYIKQIGVKVSLEVIQKEERDLGPVVTCNPIPRTINQAEYPA